MLRPRTIAAIRAVRDRGSLVILVTGRMFRSALPYAVAAGIEEPLVCYQGAVVAEPGSGEFLRHEPIPLELAREAIEAVENEGFRLNCYVDDDLYVAEITPNARAYADFQHIPITPVGDLLGWLERPPTKLVAVDDPEALNRLRAVLVGAVRRSPLHRQVAPVLPRARQPGRLEGKRARVRRRASRLRRRAHGRVRRRRERSRAARLGGLRGLGRERLRGAESPCRLALPVRRGRRRCPDARSLSRLKRMIDLKAARHDPEGYRTALARKGAAETFDAMLEADERWRALVPRIDELRSRTKLKGKPSPEQLAELQSVKEELRAAEDGARRGRGSTRRAGAPRPESSRRRYSGRLHRGRRGGAPPGRRAVCGRKARASTSRSAASTWSARLGCPVPASATGSATRRGSRSRSTGWRSTGWRRTASSRCCRRCSCARRR